MNRLVSSFIGLLLFSSTFSAQAQVEHTLLRKIAVFPIADAKHSTAEDAWWQMRELLTTDRKLLVASRRFMINRGVFQPRKTLKPADAIILGKILDAQAIMTSYLDDRVLHVKVYDGDNGFPIWEGEAQFHPAIPISDQLIKVCTKLVGDFLAAIPYQGFQIVDSMSGKLLYEKDGKTFAKIFVGAGVKLNVGDSVQWVKVLGDPGKNFLNSAKVQVLAEGEVKSLGAESVEVEIVKSTDPKLLVENSLVRFPHEIRKLKEMYLAEERPSILSSEYLSDELKPLKDFEKNQHPTATALAFLANLAMFILIAF